jgi:protein-disulfide isomerase
MKTLALATVALAGGLVGAGGVYVAGRHDGGAQVRDYLLTHPEVIPEAMGKLQARENARAVKTAGDAITRPYGSAWAGNPNGDVVLVEYYDYNCGYCRASLPVLAQLVARDPKLKIVFRELPVLAPSSRDAARASLAAARQGRFRVFHDTLYAGGRVTPQTIAAAASKAGVVVPDADRGADAEIAANLRTASELGIGGTPSWVVGDRVLVGAQPLAELESAIAEARRG